MKLIVLIMLVLFSIVAPVQSEPDPSPAPPPTGPNCHPKVGVEVDSEGRLRYLVCRAEGQCMEGPGPTVTFEIQRIGETTWNEVTVGKLIGYDRGGKPLPPPEEAPYHLGTPVLSTPLPNLVVAAGEYKLRAKLTATSRTDLPVDPYSESINFKIDANQKVLTATVTWGREIRAPVTISPKN